MSFDLYLFYRRYAKGCFFFFTSILYQFNPAVGEIAYFTDKHPLDKAFFGGAASKDTNALYFIVKDAPQTDATPSSVQRYGKAYMPFASFLAGTTMVMVKQ